MRLNGRIVAALTGFVVVAGSVSGYLLTAGSAKADNATQCVVSQALSPICNIDPVALPATSDIYLQYNATLPTGVTITTMLSSYTLTCGGQSTTNSVTARANTSVYISTSNQGACSVSAHLQVFFAGTLNTQKPATVVMEINYDTPGSSTPSTAPSKSTGGGGGGGLTGVIKGFAGKCVDDAANSSKQRAKVDIWSCNKGKSQTWTYQGGEVKHNGLCLNVKSNNTTILWACNGQPNEIFIFNTINHEVMLKAHGFSQCLTDPKNATKNGTQLTVATCKNASSQHWSLP